MSRTAEHRPAVRPRRFRHDEYMAVDLFSGFGGLTQGIERAGFTPITAANHPNAEHWIGDRLRAVLQRMEAA